MRGWKTKTFTEKTYSHHRVFGTAQNGEWRASFKNGRKDYIVGNHPVWECFRILHQMTKKPFMIGGLALGCGYLWALLRNEKRPVSSELVSFYRKEQMNRLHQFFTTHFRPVSLSSHRAH
jgi:poly-beta-1,6-N-acetyl-D-glucosamine synthase